MDGTHCEPDSGNGRGLISEENRKFYYFREDAQHTSVSLHLKNENMGKPAQIKTKPTASSVEEFIAKVPDEQKRKDSHVILKLMEKATKQKPKMWGASLIGFGELRYKSPATGREVDWFIIGFSPRKANISIYLTMNIGAEKEALEKLGKHKTGAGCLYINKLSDIDMKVLEGMISKAAKK
jgi:hypothetical protein